MSLMKAIDPSTATGKAKQLLDAVQAKLNLVPNMTKVMANSPAVLEAYLGFSGSLGTGALGPKLREQLALITAQHNHCDYCLAAHTTIGQMVGLNKDQIVSSRGGHGETPKTTAALRFAKRLLDTKGQTTESDLADLRGAGFSEAEIAEIIAHVALNVFTNYFNIATDLDLDWPEKVSYKEVA